MCSWSSIDNGIDINVECGLWIRLIVGCYKFDVEVVMKMKSKCRMLMFDERSRVPSIRISIDFSVRAFLPSVGSRHHFTDQSPVFFGIYFLVSEITEIVYRNEPTLVSCDALYS